MAQQADFRTQRKFIWMGMAAGLLMYVIVGFAVPGIVEMEAELLRLLAITFAVLSVGAGAAGHLLYKKAQSVDASAENAAQEIQKFSILAWAMDDIIGVFGIVLALLGLDTGSWLVFVVISIVLLVMHRPREDA